MRSLRRQEKQLERRCWHRAVAWMWQCALLLKQLGRQAGLWVRKELPLARLLGERAGLWRRWAQLRGG